MHAWSDSCGLVDNARTVRQRRESDGLEKEKEKKNSKVRPDTFKRTLIRPFIPLWLKKTKKHRVDKVVLGCSLNRWGDYGFVFL